MWLKYINLVQFLRYYKIILKYKDVGLNLRMFYAFMVYTFLIYNYSKNADTIIHAMKTSHT